MVARIIEINLSDLESNLRRDPESYLPDFEAQYENYSSLEATYLSAPSEYVPKLDDLLVFISQVIHLFPVYAQKFSENVSSALLSRAFGMNAHMRMAYLKAFMRLRTKGLITLQQAVDVGFRLHRCHDKQLRRLLRGFIIGDMKRTNLKNKSSKVNTLIQTFLAKSVNDSNMAVAKEAVILLVELYRRNVWKDEKTVNMIADACLAKSKKVFSKAVRFFLGHNEKSAEQDSSSDSDDNVDMNTRIKQMKLGHRVGIKSKKRAKRLDRSIENLRRKNERKKKEQMPTGINVPALNLIYDPQTFAERLFHKLEKCNDRLEIRLLLLELISHLIGIHQLLLLNFYPSLQRFLRPQQREITRLLLFAAQASHDQVPPDAILPLVRTITDNFVTDRASAEAITVGLNTIREICARCPYAVDEDLLSDLVEYKSYRNKNVVAAARSLIRLYRQINPSLLPKKEVGRPTEAVKEALVDDTDTLAATCGPSRVFGKAPVATGIAGAEVLTEENRQTTTEQGDSRRKKKPRRSKDSGEVEEGNGKAEELDLESDIDLEEDLGDDDDDDDDNEGSEHGSEEEMEVDEGAPDSPESRPQDSKDESAVPNAKEKLVDDIISTRVLTEEDFEAIRRRQAEKQARFATTGGRKRKRGGNVEVEELALDEDVLGSDEDADSDKEGATEEAHGLVSMRNITKLVKRAHSTKADRLDSIVEGREGRKKYGFQVNRMNPHASTTNREKRKNKTFQMIKHKVRRKAKRSFREKQSALRDHLKKLSKSMRH
uniref:Protein SDA1 n=2 Tax=Mesocestoides corti TaxID=53468 RepID=A0A5K3F5A4_MESCO